MQWEDRPREYLLPLSTYDKGVPWPEQMPFMQFHQFTNFIFNVDNNQSAKCFYDSCHFDLASYLVIYAVKAESLLILYGDINQGPATPDYGDTWL